ncbi:MAG: phasin family protein [Actinomycetota bacterium]
MRDDFRRVAVFTSGIAEMTRNRAEDFVRGWVKEGDVRREQAQTLVRDLLDWSAQNRKELTRFVADEIEAQLSSLGVARARDVERLEQRLQSLEEALRGTAAATADATPQRKSTGRRSRTSAPSGSKKKATTRKRTRKRSTKRST